MDDNRLYQDIAKRTDGDIYVGVVGPVRTGKSTFIKRFMEQFVIPNIESDFRRERATDELPQSAAGKTIMTTEPKFIPEEAVSVTMEATITFGSAVSRSSKNAMVASDMPFMSYQISDEQALENAVRLMKEARANAVKQAGGIEV